MMAVLFITHKFPPATGGMENQSFQLITGYSKVHKAYAIIYEGKENILFFFIKLRSRVRRMLRLYPEISVIHLNDGLMAALFVITGVNAQGRKIVATIHGLDIVFPLPLYQNKIIPLLISKIDRFICVSSATRMECEKRNFLPFQLTVVHNCVENKEWNAEVRPDISIPNIDFEKDTIILAIGRPVKRKGFSWFAKEVMPLLGCPYKFVHIGQINTKQPFFYPIMSANIKNYYNLFTGRASDTSDLIEAASDPKNNTILAGKLSDQERDYLLEKATCLVMPNIKQAGDMEGFGLVALEASMMGKTVIASSIEGITDAIQNNKNGYIVPYGKPDVWVEIIRRLADSHTSFSKSFRSFTIENYSCKKMVEGYHSVFENITNQDGASL